jgi:hypothetical protein
MPITGNQETGYMITGDSIKDYRVLALKQQLKLEIKGLRFKGPRTSYTIIKKEFGFRGCRSRVLAQLEAWIEEHLMKGGANA